MKPLKVLYKDKNILVIDKPAGVTISDTIGSLNVQLFPFFYNKKLSDYSLYPIGALDSAASGIQVFGLNSNILQELNRSWNTSRVVKHFYALVKGEIKTQLHFDFSLKNENENDYKPTTHLSPVCNFETVSLVKIWTENDCKNQIRRHLSRRCIKIIGDRKYGSKYWNNMFEDVLGLKRIFLHAYFLKLDLKSYNRKIEINCPLPIDLSIVFEKLCSNYKNVLESNVREKVVNF